MDDTCYSKDSPSGHSFKMIGMITNQSDSFAKALNFSAKLFCMKCGKQEDLKIENISLGFPFPPVIDGNEGRTN